MGIRGCRGLGFSRPEGLLDPFKMVLPLFHGCREDIKAHLILLVLGVALEIMEGGLGDTMLFTGGDTLCTAAVMGVAA